MIEFIFMLTRNDETLADAREVYASIADSGVRHVGCKDVGLPREELQRLLSDIRANGHTSHLEVVSESEEATLASARAAAEIGPDYLIGGTLIEPVQEIVADTGIRFFPYVGRIVGHPCFLRGSIAEIADDARRAEALGVDGINLLAYRYDGDVDALVEAVVDATDLPVIAAGSVLKARRDVRYRLIDGKGVVIRQDEGEVLVLNRVGARILGLLEGGATIEGVLDVLSREFEVGQAELERDTLAFVEQLVDSAILEVEGR